jgi:hypothetical protein
MLPWHEQCTVQYSPSTGYIVAGTGSSNHRRRLRLLLIEHAQRQVPHLQPPQHEQHAPEIAAVLRQVAQLGAQATIRQSVTTSKPVIVASCSVLLPTGRTVM